MKDNEVIRGISLYGDDDVIAHFGGMFNFIGAGCGLKGIEEAGVREGWKEE